MSKQFDWDKFEQHHHPETAALIKELHDQPIGPELYADRWLALPHCEGRTTRRRPIKEYWNLRKKHGFFKGGMK